MYYQLLTKSLKLRLPCEIHTSQLLQKFPAFYRNQSILPGSHGANHILLFWARRIKSEPFHSTSIRSILYFPPFYVYTFQVHIFSSDFLTQILHSFLFTIRATCSLISYALSDGPNTHNIWWGVEIAPLFLMRLPLSSPYCHPLRSKYLSQHLILEPLQSMSFP
jgi:hypothetical protein